MIPARPTISTPPEDPVEELQEEEAKPAVEAPKVAAHYGSSAPSPVIKKSKQVQRVAKRARKVENQRERLQAAQELFATQEAEAHIKNQGVVNISAKIKKVGTATHDE